MITTTLKEIEKAAALHKYDIYPVAYELLSDAFTPIEIVRVLKNVSRHCFLLESVTAAESWGRYTFLGYDPKLSFSCKDGVVKAGEFTFTDRNPDDVIREILSKYRSPKVEGLPPFTGGLVGYFAFDYLAYSEPSVKTDTPDTEGFQDADLMLFDKVIVFDNMKQKLLLIANMSLDDIDIGYRKAESELENLAHLITTGDKWKPEQSVLEGDPKPFYEKEAFCAMVEQAKHHIKEGDIFQIVLSNRLSAPFTGSLFPTYRILRTLNPSPYMFYFSGTDVEIAGASPETLVKLEDNILRTFPLAGTRKRGKTEEEDKQLEAELLADEKELAEHNMLVDLGRNDLGRVSKIGSVTVEKLRGIERFSHVMHIGSTVKGVIKKDCDALDAVKAVLPAGTLSGAPKIRACQLIGELEQDKRGVYGGAIGYLAFNGDMDTCIAIRIAYKKNGTVFVRSGAGIVADSVPEKEYEECLNKAAAVLQALERATEETA